MAFKLGDLIIDRIVNGVAENSAGQLLYLLTNLQEASINITADSVDAVDGTGTIIKTFYRGKQGEFTATNSTVSLPIINAMSGETAPTYATSNAPINMPIIITATKTGTTTLNGITDNGVNANIVVNGVESNGTLGDVIDKNEYTITAGTGGAYSTITFSQEATYDQFIIKYDRAVTKDGIKIVNRSDKFPTSVKLTLKVLIVDPCTPDVIRAAYIVLPNFQPSPEMDMTFSTDATMDFTGKLQTAYCGVNKVLYEIYVCYDDVEDAA